MLPLVILGALGGALFFSAQRGKDRLDLFQTQVATTQAAPPAPTAPTETMPRRFINPLADAPFRVTSPYGPRTNPVTGEYQSLHNGLDLGAAEGTPIHAADSGRVALAAPTGGYGNYTCIQHSASLSTCYAHQSRFAVSVGQNVTKGQVIGYVGCTGLCFGDHLHFEVRVNGSVVSPLNYL